MAPPCAKRFSSCASTIQSVEIDEGSGYLARSGFNHVCFRVDDLDETIGRFGALGYTPRNTVMDFHDRRLVFFDGPAGVVIELAEWKIAPPLLGANTDTDNAVV